MPAKRQIAIVIDTNKCMACQTCTVACKELWTNGKGMDHIWWMKVNTLPGRGYPRDWEKMGGGYNAQGKVVIGKRPETQDYGGSWGFNHEEVFYGGKGGKVRLEPKDKPTWGPNWDEDIGAGEYPNSYFFYFPRLCSQCSRMACAEACPRDAIHKQDDGVVTIQESKCHECADHLCMNGCPYKEAFWNPEAKAAQKCQACLPRLEKGIAPACVRQCPARMMWVDYAGNRDGAVHKLVNEWKVALPLHPEFGTQPNVFYVPPLAPPRIGADGRPDVSQPRIPNEYLKSLFGSQVENALGTLKEEMAKRRAKKESALMDILIVYQWKELLGPFVADPGEVLVR